LLIVEDERLVAENLSEFLQKQGFNVVAVVTTGEEAIRVFYEQKVDLILMDIRLKGAIDGIQTALVIQQSIRKVPIVFLTAYAEDQFPHLGKIDTHMFAYITKPYVANEVVAAIVRLLSESGSE
jgi:CheY-like chemotaxis protein